VVAWVLVIIIVYFLGMLFDMIVEIFARGSLLTKKGAFNLSLILTSLLIFLGIVGLLLEDYLPLSSILLLGIFLGFLISWYSMRVWWRAFLACLGVAGGLVLLIYVAMEFESLAAWFLNKYVV